MKEVRTGLAALGMVALEAVISAWPAQYLWNNWLITAVDGVYAIGFWQALGLYVLFGILFKAKVSNSSKG